VQSQKGGQKQKSKAARHSAKRDGGLKR